MRNSSCVTITSPYQHPACTIAPPCPSPTCQEERANLYICWEVLKTSAMESMFSAPEVKRLRPCTRSTWGMFLKPKTEHCEERTVKHYTFGINLLFPSYPPFHTAFLFSCFGTTTNYTEIYFYRHSSFFPRVFLTFFWCLTNETQISQILNRMYYGWKDI